MQRGQATVVIEILPEQNLVCVIIVQQARNEAKIHSTWCIHCFQPNTHQAPQQQADTVQRPPSKPTESCCNTQERLV